MSASARRLRGLARIGARAASLKPRADTAAALTTLRPGIEPEVRDVDHEVRERIHDRRQQGDAEHRREVECDGGRGRITAQPGPAEDRLCQHRTREKTSECQTEDGDGRDEDRKSTRLNSSHLGISYAVFCLKKKKNIITVSQKGNYTIV